MELTIEQLERRGVQCEGLEIRRWRHLQRLPSGRRMRLCDLARLAGCTVDTLSMVERGVQRPGARLRARLWAVIIASSADGGKLRPLAKCSPAAVEPGSGAQLGLPLVG
jgi:hypothetical protein